VETVLSDAEELVDLVLRGGFTVRRCRALTLGNDLLADGYHVLAVAPRHLLVNNHSCRIILTDQTIGRLLSFDRSFPRFVNVLEREVGKFRYKSADKVAGRLQTFAVRDRVDANGTIEQSLKSGTGDPHPVARID